MITLNFNQLRLITAQGVNHLGDSQPTRPQGH